MWPRLPGLGLSPAELERMREQLSSILTSIEKIEELDTTAIPPTAQTIELTDVFREDVAEPVPPARTGAAQRSPPSGRLLRSAHTLCVVRRAER